MIRINSDAAINQVAKTAGIGLVIVTNDQYQQLAIPMPYQVDVNNHVLEFQAVKEALSWLIEHDLTNEMVFIETDSKVVVDVVEKELTKNKTYQPLLEDILSLKVQFPVVTLTWIPEKQNKGADNLAKQALRKPLP